MEPVLPLTATEQDGGRPPRPQSAKLDLSRLDPPEALEEYSLEEITIDGICGVY